MIPPPNENRVFLHAGQLCLAREPTVIVTVLGSCVAATMHVPRLALGGMCHAVLPTGAPGDPRVVPVALRQMAGWLERQGAMPYEIETRLFGGGDMFGDPAEGLAPTVGEANVATALEVIRRLRVNLVYTDVRGERGRKVTFDTLTGRGTRQWIERIGRGVPVLQQPWLMAAEAERKCSR